MFKNSINLFFMLTLIQLTAAIDSAHPNTVKAASIAQQNLHRTFQSTSLLYGLSTLSDENFIEQRCHAHLQLFQQGVMDKLPWALKMFDASASIEPGFTFGNNFWLGNREVCGAVGQPTNMQISAHLSHHMNAELLTSVAPFATDFRVVYLRHNSSWQVDPLVLVFASRVHVALCLPSACSEREIRRLTNAYLATDLFAANELYDMHLQYEYTKDLKLKAATFMRASLYLCCIFILTTIGLTVVAMSSKKLQDIEILKEKVTKVATGEENGTKAPHSDSQQALQQVVPAVDLIACYDIQANWRHIFTPTKAGQTFAALNGLRFGSALCVTFYHYLMFLFNGTRNKLTLFSYQVHIGNVDIFVDIFFTISGFLQAYNHFRNVKLLQIIRQNNLTQNLKLIGMYLFHRYLRLAPMYLLVIGLSDFGAQLMDDISLFHNAHKVHVNCERHWWRNVLFIQNFFNHNDMCVLWTWSLACDMQFSVLATVLLFTYIKHPGHTKICLVVLVIANILYTYTNGLKLNFDHSLESTFALLTEIYINPFSRILAYISGGIAGWFYVEQRQLPFTLSKNTKQFFGYLVPLIFFGCIFKPPYHNLSPFNSTLILLLERFCFSMVSSVLILANAKGHMRWFFRIFESFVFQKFNKVAYAMFLLNPMLAFGLPGFSQSNLYANPLNMLAEFIGLLVVLLLFSILFTLLFDIPYQNLSRLLVNYQSKRKLG
ncbi:nose resistant to fluoxetine protein 6-like [Anastrepha obliqua]|uniref:nose resistant to fluoxetine protein 6-like n=1 Tax=Anastrepha obliqua TaxID=95512 RepID=UPI00240A7550|nr:nose resistant to fluoxetine protein 6-like [Anastrepha obliqua]